jgi:hypothetical protein
VPCHPTTFDTRIASERQFKTSSIIHIKLFSDPLLRLLSVASELVAIVKFDIVATHWPVHPVAIMYWSHVGDKLDVVNIFNMSVAMAESLDLIERDDPPFLFI